jgi:predicted nucleic acid-binding protein
MVIFIDTSALYALLDADDCDHERARAAWEGWSEQPLSFVCSNYVLLESIALIQRRLGIEAVRLFQEEMVPLFHIHWVNPEIHASATSALLAARRRDISLVDWTSFELMRRLGIRTAFTFDQHFAEQGFEVLPPV